MARAKYEEWEKDPDKRILMTGWARAGLSDQQIAKNMGISRSTLNEWKKKYPDIAYALKKGKEVSDYEVENALYKRATGYTEKVKKVFKCKVVEYDECGKKKKEEEVLKEGIEEVHFPPDTGAAIFWLTNRKPEEWKNRRDGKEEDGDGEEGVAMLSPVDMKVLVKEVEENRKKENRMVSTAEAGADDVETGG